MFIGVRYSSNSKFVNNLTNMVDIYGTEGYIWFIDCLCIYGSDDDKYQNIFKKSCTGDEMLTLFDSLTDGFVQSIRIRRYKPNERILPINTFEEYNQSQCSLIILCYDVYYYEFYSKCENEVKNFYDHCISQKYDNVELFTEENDRRTALYID